MARQQWFGTLVVGASLGVLGCGDDPTPGADASTDTGNAIDLGTVDTGTVDTGAIDTGAVDTGAVDTGAVDTGAVDTGAVDTGAVDTGVVDSGVTDTGVAPDTGTPDAGTPDSGAPLTARTTATNGSAVVLTSDDLFAVATNRTANTIRVFSTTATAATPVGTDIATPDGEPWAAVIGNDDNTAYVILRHTQELVRVSNLRTAPAITARVTVGSEPTGLAISPTGRHVYVANWANGTVSDVDVSGATMTVSRSVDLNAALIAAPGAPLGSSVTASRPGLAHPRAIVVTNDGDTDDADETVYVTEFFAQYVAPGTTLPSGEARLDVERRGLVYRFNAGTGVAGDAINLQPFATTSAATEAGCFPNQLYAAAIKGDRLFVTSVCESPRRPVNAQQNLFAAVSLINLTTNVPDTANHVLLTRAFADRYAATATAVPDTNARRFPLIPNDIAFVRSSNVAYVTSYGSDAVFRVQFNADFTLNQVGQGTAQHFIDLGGFAAAPGRLPIGIAITNAATTPRAVVLNENSRNLSLVSLNDQAVVAGAEAAPAPAAGRETNNNLGRRFFVTGLGRWSLNGQGWGSCEGCHPDGLTDNVTWTFAAGPRQTTSLDGSFDRTGTNQRIFNWTGILDEVHDFEANTRGTSGGVGALVHRTSTPLSAEDRIINDGTATTGAQVATATPQAGLNGSNRSITAGTGGAPSVRSILEDWEQIDLYVRTIRPPRAPNNLVAADVMAGRQLFIDRNCGACHGSATGTNLWTVSRRFYEPNEANNAAAGLLRARTYTGFPTALAALNPASANAGRTAAFRILPADITAQGAGGGDQISCVLRAVGTIGGTTTATTAVAPSGVTVFELRANGMASQGITGYNVPALVGMGSGAPFFHGGNARTLEEVFDNLFRAHHQTLAANFLDLTDTQRATQIRQLVAFLVSIDDSTDPVAFPTTITGLPNVDLCSGFAP